MFLGLEIPVVISLVTAFSSLLLGYLAHRRGKKELDAKSLDSHLIALREMYKELVDDLRTEVDRLQEENRRLRTTVKELSDEANEAIKRERNLRGKIKRLEDAAESV